MIAVVDPVQVHSPAQATPKANPIETLQKTVSASRLNYLASMPAQVLLPLRPTDLQAQNTITARRFSGASDLAGLEHGAVEEAGIPARKVQEPVRGRAGKINRQESTGMVRRQAKRTRPGRCWRCTSPRPRSKPTKCRKPLKCQWNADLSKHSLPTLIGVLDLVRAGGRIVDFKSTGKTPDPEDAAHQNETQMSCYSVLYREATGHQEAGRELHHLVKTKTPKLVITELGPMNERQQVRLFRTMESYVEGLAREDFVPSPGFHCAGCEFLNECRAWA